MSDLKEGDLAPDFTLPDTLEGDFKLSDYRGQNVVLYFYPKDDTPGCTIEANQFTAAIDKFTDKNTVVCGISYDDVVCHKDFIDKYDLKIELLSDEDGTVAKLYGSAGVEYPSRDTFVIDAEGKIKKIFRQVDPEGHALQVLESL